ncbi:MAG: PH domain-containing protein [Thermoplasmata archaeon]|nr:MAG: PH domain-containing protein [Thermoplasmata archaeon]
MRQLTEKERAEFPMGGNETLLMMLRPHPFSFIRYYSVGIVLLLWIVLTFWIYDQGWFEQDWLPDDLQTMMPALFLALGALIVGRWLVSGYSKGFRYLYWFALIVLLVVTGLFIWYWDDSATAFYFAFLYGIALGVMGIGFAEFYRRAFHYMVTNQRVAIRYKLFSVEETNMRFEKIEDFEVIRPFSWRIVGLGTIRPYTGTEDAKADKNIDFHGPKEAIYGVRHPNEVKKQLIQIILERDQWDKQMVDLLEEQKRAREQPAKAPPAAAPAAPVAAAAAVAAAPPPEPEPAPEPTPEPAPTSGVSYYQPAPPPEPTPEPATTKNYERIDPSQYAESTPEPAMAPPPPDEEQDPEPEPSAVRTMMPETHEPDTPLEMRGGDDMDFETGHRTPRPEPEIQPSPPDEGEEWRRRDEKKPRSL